MQKICSILCYIFTFCNEVTLNFVAVIRTVKQKTHTNLTSLPDLSVSPGVPLLLWHGGDISVSDAQGMPLSSCPFLRFAFPVFLWNCEGHLLYVFEGCCGWTLSLKKCDCSGSKGAL